MATVDTPRAQQDRDSPRHSTSSSTAERATASTPDGRLRPMPTSSQASGRIVLRRACLTRQHPPSGNAGLGPGSCPVTQHQVVKESTHDQPVTYIKTLLYTFVTPAQGNQGSVRGGGHGDERPGECFLQATR